MDENGAETHENSTETSENAPLIPHFEAEEAENELHLTPEQRRIRRKWRRMMDEHRRKSIDITSNVLETRPAGEWLARSMCKSAPRLLCGSLWREGELAIMFADTGVGKSIFAVQLAEAIARGRSIGPLNIEVPWSKVLYLDFELTEEQFTMRYSRGARRKVGVKGPYRFSKNFMRSQMVWDGEVPSPFKTGAELIGWSVVQTIRDSDAKVVIVDNISYLGGASDGANAALALMKRLKGIKADFGISILVLAHTPKRFTHRHLTVEDLQGSKMLSNFADSIFAIGTGGTDHSLRYLKQIKVRSGMLDYGENNVLAFRLEKLDNFPQFIYLEERSESSFMLDKRSRSPEIARNLLMAEAKRLAADEKLTEREIARRLGISNATAHRYLNS